MSSTEGKPIECLAAVAYEANKPLTIEKITVEPPKTHEIRVKILDSALCHTDAYTLSGADPEGLFPCILGHEASGEVESVGPEVTDFTPGDHVILLYTAECGECSFCKSPDTNLCVAVRSTQGKGVMPDGTVRFKNSKGEPIHHFMGCSSFSEYTVVADVSAVKIDKNFPTDKAALLGCGVTTGYGAALKTANVQEGSSVAIFGAGAVGLAVAQGAKARKASKIIMIDTNPNKKTWAMEFGATDFVNPLTDLAKDETIVSKLCSMSPDGYGIDYTFDCTGNVQVMSDALMASRRGTGVSVIIGVAKSGEVASIRPFFLVTGRTWKGTAYGGIKGRSEMNQLIQDHEDGKLKLSEFITHRRKFSEINEAFHDLHQGDCLRTTFSF
ncbi:S-(hydroxymethyl)glutathione dehydrogenase [Hanseniaspora vineae]